MRTAGRSRAVGGPQVLIRCLLILSSAVFLFPFLHTVAQSFSDPRFILSGSVFFLPRGPTLDAYRALLKDLSMLRSLAFTVELTVLGVAVSLVLSTLAAFPLSKPGLKGRNLLLGAIVFTMYFSGGLIPTYILVKRLGFLDSLWALILPGAVNTFNMVVMMTYFRGIPKELEEAVEVEGARPFLVLLRVVLPLSTATLATMVIFYGVGYWNTFFSGLLYIQDPKKYTLQVRLYQTLDSVDTMINGQLLGASDREVGSSAKLVAENLKSAMVVLTTAPIIVLYPFMQRYFVKGATVGALKG